MDSAFWNDFYSMKIKGDSELVKSCSTFALYSIKFLPKDSTVVDLGCGNGRDAIFIKNYVKDVIGVDMSAKAIEHVQLNGVIGIQKSMTELGDALDNIENKVAYSRFSLHSVNSEQQDIVLRWISKNCKMGFIETRSVNDPRYGKGIRVGEDAFKDTHYRRFTRLSDLTKSIVDLGGQIIKAEEEFHDAVFGDDKAVVNRIIYYC